MRHDDFYAGLFVLFAIACLLVGIFVQFFLPCDAWFFDYQRIADIPGRCL